MHEGVQPAAVGNLLLSDTLAGEDVADVDLELSDADAPQVVIVAVRSCGG